MTQRTEVDYSARPVGVDSTRGWLVVAATFVSTTTVFGVTYSFTTFLSAMSDEFGSGNGSTAVMFGLTIFFLFVLGLPAGRASDRWGPRPVVLVGCAAMVIGLALTSVVDRLWLGYLTYGFGIGVGAACCYVPLVSQVSAWFDRRRAVAIGVAVSGIGVGTLIGPPLAEALIVENGWRWTYRFFAVVCLVLLLVVAGLAFRAPRADDQEPLDLSSVLRSRVFRSMYVAGFLMTLALFVPFVFLLPYAEEQGISSASAAALISVLGVGSMVGRLMLGAFVNVVGLLRLYQISFGVLGGSFVIWLFGGGSYIVLAIFAFVLGTSYGGYVALSPPAAAELFGLAGLGTVLGALYTAGGAGGLIGPAFAGWLIDTTGSYRPAIVFALVIGLLSVLTLRTAIAAHEHAGQVADYSDWAPESIPEGWELLAQDRRLAVLAELNREIGEGHALSGKTMSVVANCAGCDETLLFVEDDFQWALVHPTWKGAVEAPPWPTTTMLGPRLPFGAMVDHAEHVTG